jgi:hypothetical protein
MVAIVALSGLVVGFVAGLFSFRIKSRWCPACGSTLKCVDCLTVAGVVVQQVPAETDDVPNTDGG